MRNYLAMVTKELHNPLNGQVIRWNPKISQESIPSKKDHRTDLALGTETPPQISRSLPCEPPCGSKNQIHRLGTMDET